MSRAYIPLGLALLGLALACIALTQSEGARPNDGLPLVKADYQVCASVRPPPIRAPKRDVFHPQANAEAV